MEHIFLDNLFEKEDKMTNIQFSSFFMLLLLYEIMQSYAKIASGKDSDIGKYLIIR